MATAQTGPAPVEEQVKGIRPGVVVETVVHGSEAEIAGLRLGDVLLSWNGDTREAIQSPFDLAGAEMKQGTATVWIEGFRDDTPHRWMLQPGVWNISARPNFDGTLLSSYRQAEQLAQTAKITEAAALWDASSNEVRANPEVQAWILWHAAGWFAKTRQWDRVDDSYRRAININAIRPAVSALLFCSWASTYQLRNDWSNAEKYYRSALESSDKQGAETPEGAKAWTGLGSVAKDRGDLKEAEQSYRRALLIQEKLSPGSLELASTLFSLGHVFWMRGDLDESEKLQQRAMEIRRRLAPASLAYAASLNTLGTLSWTRGDLTKAEEYYKQAFAIRERMAPNSLELAGSLNNLGLIARERGDFAAAGTYYQRALTIREQISPDSLDVADSLSNLGVVAWQTGDLVRAEDYYRQGLTIRQKLAPGTLRVAASFNNLAAVALDRSDLESAKGLFSQAVAIKAKLAPNSLDLADSLNNLGVVEEELGDFEAADKYDREAFEIRKKLAPESPVLATSLTNLGVLAEKRGDPVHAEKYQRQAFAIKEKLSPNGLDMATTLQYLGELAAEHNTLDEAESDYRRALAIRENLAPGSSTSAETLVSLANVMRRRGQLGTAQELFERALDALDTQLFRLGGTDNNRASFRAKHMTYYKDYVDLLVSRGETEHAFEVLERSRGRLLLEMLLAVRLNIHNGASPLIERKRALQEALVAKANQRIRLLETDHTEEQLAALGREIEQVRSECNQLDAEIRKNDPEYAALMHPQVFGVKEIQKALDDNTVLLEYSLAKGNSYLFVVTSASLTVAKLPGRDSIEADARHYYQLLTERNRASIKDTSQQKRRRLDAADAQLAKLSLALSRTLLDEVQEKIASKRLMIVSDGALQYVPFAALPVPPGHGSPALATLADTHEITNLQSASLLPLLQARDRNRRQKLKQVLVLADPVFDPSDPRLHAETHSSAAAPEGPHADAPIRDTPSTRALARSAVDLEILSNGKLSLPRLPFSRDEAKAILVSGSPGENRAALDFDATRALAVSSELAQYRVVHFATHALVDNANPQLSGLVLSLLDAQGHPQDGFLQLEDVYNLNLEADLVVLSACKTALGKQIDGEGMVGLTRGFIYAGADRVVSSLWNTEDFVSAKFMAEFYKAMQQDHLSPASALRRAQLALRKHRQWASPYYWAAFVIYGDGK